MIREERKTAYKLECAVKTARNLGDASVRPQYNRVIQRIDRLTLYFEKMADAIEGISYEAESMYSRLNTMISDGTENVKHAHGKMML